MPEMFSKAFKTHPLGSIPYALLTQRWVKESYTNGRVIKGYRLRAC